MLGFWRIQGRENRSRGKITLLESAGKEKDGASWCGERKTSVYDLFDQ
jgi:hypothetical protein